MPSRRTSRIISFSVARVPAMRCTEQQAVLTKDIRTESCIHIYSTHLTLVSTTVQDKTRPSSTRHPQRQTLTTAGRSNHSSTRSAGANSPLQCSRPPRCSALLGRHRQELANKFTCTLRALTRNLTHTTLADAYGFATRLRLHPLGYPASSRTHNIRNYAKYHLHASIVPQMPIPNNSLNL